MGCLLALVARVALLAVWVVTPLVGRAFHGGWVLPVLGILFLPITTVTYVVVFALGNGVTGWPWLWVVAAVLFDLGAHGSGVRANRHHLPGSMAAGRGPTAHAQ